MKRIELTLHCELNDFDLHQRAQQMAEALREKARVSKRKAKVTKDFRDQLDEIEGRLSVAAEAIREKSEYRLVPCFVQFNVPTEGSKRTVRADTGEVVREERMSDGERQMNLPITDNPEHVMAGMNISTSSGMDHPAPEYIPPEDTEPTN